MSVPNPEQITIISAMRQFNELSTDELVLLYNYVTSGWNPSELDPFQKVKGLFTEKTADEAPKLHALVAQAVRVFQGSYGCFTV